MTKKTGNGKFVTREWKISRSINGPGYSDELEINEKDTYCRGLYDLGIHEKPNIQLRYINNVMRKTRVAGTCVQES